MNAPDLLDAVLDAGGLPVLVPYVEGPALAAYLRGDDGVHRAHAIQVLAFADAGIGRIVSFNDAGLFPMFALPGVASPGAGHHPGRLPASR